MRYTEFLSKLHEGVAPHAYLEIGVRDGNSLRLSTCRSIGIDPRFNIIHEIRCDVRLFRMTSDDFFAQHDVREFTDGADIDLAFIDGLHLAEYAFRDLLNALRAVRHGGLIVLDDVVPASMEITTRDQLPGAWTGDVYKVPILLREWDADMVTVDTSPSGLCVLRCDRSLIEPLEAKTKELQETLIGSRYVCSTREGLVDRLAVIQPAEALARLGLAAVA